MDFSQEKRYSQVYNVLQDLIKSKPHLLILGIGENRMGDDGIGPYISFHLSEAINNPNILIMNGGIVPEERLAEMEEFKPELMIVIDAAEIDKEPGQIGVYHESQMLTYLPISSHSMPLPIFFDRVKRCAPEVKIYLFGIRPFSMDFLDTYILYKEEKYSLDDKEENVDIPFYAFNLSDDITKVGQECIKLFKDLLKIYD